jgi:hypothetical protein
MVTKRTGKPRGRRVGSRKSFLTDRDRYVIGMIDGLRAAHPNNDFEHLAMFAIYFHQREKIALPPDPLKNVRRLGLKPDMVSRLKQGVVLQQWGAIVAPNRGPTPPDVNRLFKKMKRLAGDREAERWRYYVGAAWATLYTHPNISLMRQLFEQVGELKYFEDRLMPLLAFAFETI